MTASAGQQARFLGSSQVYLDVSDIFYRGEQSLPDRGRLPMTHDGSVGLEPVVSAPQKSPELRSDRRHWPHRAEAGRAGRFPVKSLSLKFCFQSLVGQQLAAALAVARDGDVGQDRGH